MFRRELSIGESSAVPAETQWERVSSQSIWPIARLKGQNRVFFRHWEVKLTFPVMVATLLSISFFVFVFAVWPCVESKSHKIVSLVCVLVSLALFIWSYSAAVLMDPGFLPFNWYVTQRSKYSWEEQLSGLAVTHEQVEYAMTHPRPPVCSFSHSFGRFILRGDHVCGWIANWVGKRNHKQFMLVMFYGCLYTIFLVLPRLFPGVPVSECSPRLGFFADMCTFIESMISVILLANVITNCIQLASNRTSIESWKNIEEVGDRSFRKEVCGESPIICWLCPVPAFPDDLPDFTSFQMATV